MTTPTISNVSGTIATGQTLTITGTNMMDEDKTNWSNTFSYGFEGSNPTDDGYCGVGPCGGTYDTNIRLSGNQSIKHHISGYSPPGPGGLMSYNSVAKQGQDQYVRMYIRYHSVTGEWPRDHIKMLLDCCSSYNRAYQPVTANTISEVYNMVVTDDYQYLGAIPSGHLVNDRWYCMEVRFKNTNPQSLTGYMDGVQIVTQNINTIANNTMMHFGFINAAETTDSFDLTSWIDNFTISTSQIYPSSTIEIANSSNYYTATKIYQEPVYLSDGSVQIKADLTNLGSGPYYLFVTNNRQETSLPYSLSSTCPSVECSFQLNII